MEDLSIFGREADVRGKAWQETGFNTRPAIKGLNAISGARSASVIQPGGAPKTWLGARKCDARMGRTGAWPGTGNARGSTAWSSATFEA